MFVPHGAPVAAEGFYAHRNALRFGHNWAADGPSPTIAGRRPRLFHAAAEQDPAPWAGDGAGGLRPALRPAAEIS